MMCSIEYADPADVSLSKWRTARTSHICEECGRRIAVGERHHWLKQLYDGLWMEFRTCQHCDAAGQWLVTVCGGYCWGGLREELKEHRDEGYHDPEFDALIEGIEFQWGGGIVLVPDKDEVAALGRRMMAAKVAADGAR